MSTAVLSSCIDMVVNGHPVRIDSPRNHHTLLDALRERGLTGAKEGCAEGECGACAVLIVMPHGRGSAYKAINSCLMLTSAAAGREVYTVEGLAGDGGPCDAQLAMAAAGGSQCGYCTPGFVMSLFAEQYRPDRSGPCDPLAMSGNLCRCTGYRPIGDAARSLGAPPDGALLARLREPPLPLGPLVLSDFSRPQTIEECVALMARRPAARLIAGGTDLVVESNLRGHRFEHLVSVEGIRELYEWEETDGAIRIGAALPLAEIAARWTSAPAAVHEWLTLFASPPIRERATLGGNLATASPIGDSAPLLLALDALVHIAGVGGRRTVPLTEFFSGYRRTALSVGELITTVEIPKPLPATIAFYKIAKRRLDDISTVAAAIALDRDAAGVVRRARFAFGGVAPTPLLVTAAGQAATGASVRHLASRVAPVIAGTLQPLTDHRGSAEYRRDVAVSLIEKFAWECQQ
jgi:xanthine dehydrogenase small subunit